MARIRRATPDDAQGTTDLVNTVGAEGRFLLRERATWTIDEERATLAGADGVRGIFLVAEVAGRVVGMLSVLRGKWSKNHHVGELAIACRPEARGVGLGRALMVAGIGWARSAGVRKLTLAVFASNETALALYRAMGFVEEGRLRGQFLIEGRPVDDVLMALWLGTEPGPPNGPSTGPR